MVKAVLEKLRHLSNDIIGSSKDQAFFTCLRTPKASLCGYAQVLHGLREVLAWFQRPPLCPSPFSLLSPLPEDPPQQRPGAGHCSWVPSGYVFHLPFPAVGGMEIVYENALNWMAFP